jgi:hypothetical protein
LILSPIYGFCLSQAQCLSNVPHIRLAWALGIFGFAGILMNGAIQMRPSILEAGRRVLGNISPVNVAAWTVVLLALGLSVYALTIPKPMAFSHVVGQGTEPPKSAAGYHLGDEWYNTSPEVGENTGWICAKPRRPIPGQDCAWAAKEFIDVPAGQ